MEGKKSVTLNGVCLFLSYVSQLRYFGDDDDLLTEVGGGILPGTCGGRVISALGRRGP